jgi:uncharacterized protein
VLKIGSADRLLLREECFGTNFGLRLLYISDLHLSRRNEHIAAQVLEAAHHSQPDIIILGGDLVDTKHGLPLLLDTLRALPAPVWAIAGNHDEIVGIDLVRACVESAGARWLDTELSLSQGLTLSGRCTPATDFTALCAHNPEVFPQAVACGFRLVLAGHLHGCQAVFGDWHGRWYPGAWFYRWNGPRFIQGESTMIVSRGVHDTLPVRWNCPREVILCSL